MKDIEQLIAETAQTFVGAQREVYEEERGMDDDLLRAKRALRLKGSALSIVTEIIRKSLEGLSEDRQRKVLENMSATQMASINDLMGALRAELGEYLPWEMQF
jgi:hypothetical protein